MSVGIVYDTIWHSEVDDGGRLKGRYREKSLPTDTCVFPPLLPWDALAPAQPVSDPAT